MSKILPVTVAQAEQIRKMANEKCVGRDVFQRLLSEGAFTRVLDGAMMPSGDIIAAVKEGRTELWLHPEQKTVGYVNGRTILRSLTENGLLKACIDLEQAKAIRAEGISFWWKHFNEKFLPAWRSVEDDSVWYLSEYAVGVVLRRYWIDSQFNRACHTLLLRKPASKQAGK